MPKVHNIGKQRFVQLLNNYKVEWGIRIAVKGWTQEITEPFRTSAPWIVRLPFNKALVFGKWTGRVNDEEDALNRATLGRVLKDEDFQEGWQAPAYKTAAADIWDIYA